MVNYDNDHELKEDYEPGWSWLEVDTGPAIALHSGFHQCLMDPIQDKPEDFFEALFNWQMYTIMAEETNRYTQRKIQEGKFFHNFFIPE